jgi:hypothetical protein
VPKGRVTDVVYQRKSFCKIDVEAEGSRDRARDLGYFERVRQPVTEVVGVAPGEYLRFRFQPPECSSVNDAVTVALKVVAVGMVGLREPASARLSDVHRVGGEHEKRIEEKKEIW